MREQPNGTTLTAQTSFTITAIDVADGTTSLSWVYGLTELPGVDLTPAETAELNEFVFPELRYSINEFGEFMGVSNVEDLRKFITDSFSAFSPAEQTNEVSFLTTIEALPDSAFAQMFAPEIQLLHFFDGVTVSPGESTPFDEELPNPIGGQPLRNVAELAASDELDEENCAVITWTSRPDPEATTELISEALGVDLYGGEIPEDVAINRQLQLELDLTTMRPRALTVSQTVEVGGLAHSETESLTYLE